MVNAMANLQIEYQNPTNFVSILTVFDLLRVLKHNHATRSRAPQNEQ